MSYKVQADLADDAALRRRVAACAASEGVTDPDGWAYQHRWALSAQPGWVEAYRDAIASGVREPGADENAITDGKILAAVQALREPGA